MAGEIKKIFINGKQHYKWTYEAESKDTLVDFLSHLEAQPDWKGEITVDNKNKNITLVAKSIMSLEEMAKEGVMDYELVEALILHIGLQMLTLQKHKKGVLFLSLNDIIVIDYKLFFLGNLQYVLDIKGEGAGAGAGASANADEQLILSYPMKLSKEDERFLAPEVLQGKKVLPFITSITAGYYSLAKLCVYCLGLDVGDLTLGPIMGSKMYFFLQRCLAKEPSERGFLYL